MRDFLLGRPFFYTVRMRKGDQFLALEALLDESPNVEILFDLEDVGQMTSCLGMFGDKERAAILVGFDGRLK